MAAKLGIVAKYMSTFSQARQDIDSHESANVRDRVDEARNFSCVIN
jgi:hypothetical protein